MSEHVLPPLLTEAERCIEWLEKKARRYMLALQIVPEDGPQAVRLSEKLCMVEYLLQRLRALSPADVPLPPSAGQAKPSPGEE